MAARAGAPGKGANSASSKDFKKPKPISIKLVDAPASTKTVARKKDSLIKPSHPKPTSTDSHSSGNSPLNKSFDSLSDKLGNVAAAHEWIGKMEKKHRLDMAIVLFPELASMIKKPSENGTPNKSTATAVDSGKSKNSNNSLYSPIVPVCLPSSSHSNAIPTPIITQIPISPAE